MYFIGFLLGVLFGVVCTLWYCSTKLKEADYDISHFSEVLSELEKERKNK